MTPEEFIAELETCRLVNTIASHTWVVMSGHALPLKFTFNDLGNGTKTATDAEPCALWRADQFTRPDAETLAGFVIDGTGKRGVAIFINDAVDMLQHQMREVINVRDAAIHQH